MTKNKVEKRMKDKKGKKVIKWAGYLVTVLAFVFIIRTILNMDIDFSQFGHPLISIGKMIVPAIFMAINCLIGGYAWSKILSYLSEKSIQIPMKSIISVYAKANIAKYLPGNVMQFAGRNVLGAQYGLSQFCMLASTIVEVFLLIFTAFFMVIILSFNIFKETVTFIWDDPTYRNIVIFVFTVGIICVIGACFFLYKKEKYRTVVKKILNKQFFSIFVRVEIIDMYSFFVMGLVFYTSLKGIVGVDVNIWTAIVASIVSWVVGYIVPGAPGGIGIRETILTLLLANAYGEEIILIGAIVFRIISVIGDILAYLVNVLFIEKSIDSRGQR